MTWTYSGDPSSSDLDWVRWKVQDTDEDEQLVRDKEINAELAVGTKESAAVAVARVIARRFARLADISEGDVSIRYGESARRYGGIVADLESEVLAPTRPSQTAHQFSW